MVMMDHIMLPEVRPFAVAGAMIVVVGAVELLAMLVGFSLSELVGRTVDLDAHSDSPLVNALAWMNLRGVPLLVYLMITLAFFAIAGFLIQDVAAAIRSPLPLVFAVPLALVLAAPLVRWTSGALAHLIPRDESYAVDLSSLVGRVGRVAVGPLDQGPPGRVRVKDEHDNLHIVTAVAAPNSPPLPQGAEVLLVDRINSRFIAVAAPDETKSRVHEPARGA